MAVSEARTKQANEYIKQKMLFNPRMFNVMTTVAPEPAERFADFYNSVWQDGALPRKIKELIFTAIGVTYMSPRCLVHVIPAIEAGATDGEIFEAVTVATLAAGFVPGGPGIPYAFEYAVKVLEVAAKYRNGEPWEYLKPAEITHGIW
jgi:alkylhydroperoxidase/carboxymuconolactone decarboxylase family protein YurZ